MQGMPEKRKGENKMIRNLILISLILTIIGMGLLICNRLTEINNSLGVISATNISANVELRREAEQATAYCKLMADQGDNERQEFYSYLGTKGILTGYRETQRRRK